MTKEQEQINMTSQIKQSRIKQQIKIEGNLRCIIITMLFGTSFLLAGESRTPEKINAIVGDKNTVSITPTKEILLSNTKMLPILCEIINGKPISPQDKEKWLEIFSQYNTTLFEKYKTSNFNFPEPDRTTFYINANKMAIISPLKHGGWPFISTLRLYVLDELKTMIEKDNDPFVVYCSIFPALYRGENEYAAKSFDELMETEPALAKNTIMWSYKYYRHSGQKVEWIVDYYTDKEMPDKIQNIADILDISGSREEILLKAELLENIKKYTEAETCYKEIEKRYNYLGDLVGFYQRNLDNLDNSGIPFQQQYNKLKNRCFPNGMKEVKKDSFQGAPLKGVIFNSENRRTLRLKLPKGTIIVALNGYLVENVEQYDFISEGAGKGKRLSLIYWNNNEYVAKEIPVKDRPFGVPLENYTYENSK